MNTRKFRNATVAFSTACLLAVGSIHAATIGFNQDAAGPWDYNTPANWVGSNIDGIWDSSLTLLANQTVTFDADTTLATDLAFLYTGSFNETLRADGSGDRTLTLGGNLLLNTVSTNRTITLGSNTANQKLNIDLGGTARTFEVRGTAGNQRSLTFLNNISNGSMVLQGSGIVNLTPGVTTNYNLTGITLKNIEFKLNSNKVIVALADALTIDGAGGTNASGNSGGISIMTLASGAQLSANSLVRANGGLVLFRGTAIGGGSTSVTFTNAPTLIGGGGAAGSTNISIIPWALGGTSSSLADTFVTYDANGVRTLDPSSEFVNYTAGYSGTIAGTDNNVKVADGGTYTFTDEATVNSLSVNYNGSVGSPTVINGTTINVTSGAVSLVSRQGATLNADLDFGTAQGVIYSTQGKGSAVSGAISGSGGLVIAQSQAHALFGSGGSGLNFNSNAANSSYTGDTYVIGRASVVDGLLPNGSRTGNVFVSGILEANTITINGLNGAGVVSKLNSGSGTLTLGDNNADGNFTGIVNGQFNLDKIGNGTQILAGISTYSGSTTVSAGTLVVNGSIASSSGVSVADGATLAGSGTTSSVTLADNAIIAPGNSPGTLHTGSLVLSNASILNFDLAGIAGSNDLLDVNGDLTLDGILNVTDLPGFGVGQYLLLSYTGQLTDNTLDLGSLPAGFLYGIDTNTSGSVLLNVYVPEPTSIALLSIAGLMFAGSRKRRARCA